MRVVPERPFWLQIVTVFGGIVVGPLCASRLAELSTPGSALVQGVAPLAFGAIFVIGLLLWMGLGVVTVVASGLWRLVRGRRPGPPGLRSDDRIVPSGYRSFVFVGAFVGMVTGALAGAITGLSILEGLVLWTAAGLAYGAVLSVAAHHGALPFPEPE